MIEAQGLTRRYGEFTAVQGITFSVPGGEIMGILGPNGAGKTTTIRMITGFLPPSSGQVTVNGLDLLTEPRKARREIGYLPETVALYGEMRVSEYLSYRARLESMSRAEARQAIPSTIESCLLTDVEHQIVGTLSKGYRQRVGLAAAILHSPGVLVLDEPTVGLDPKQIIAIRKLIRDLGRERTLLISTHILPEVEQLCHRVVIIDRGRLVAQGTPQELREQSQGNARLRVTVKDAPADVTDVLGSLHGVESVLTGDSRAPSTDEPAMAEASFRLECGPGEDLRESVFRAAVERNWVLLELSEEKVSLEDVFVRLTGRDAAEQGATGQASDGQASEGQDSEGQDSERVAASDPPTFDETTDKDQEVAS